LFFNHNERVPEQNAASNCSIFLLLTIFAAITMTGCSVYKPYAQNPFNPDARLLTDSVASSSDSHASKALDVGLAAASRPIPGAIPHGAGFGIAATALLLGSGSSNKPINGNFIVAGMPLSMASNEQDAKIKLGSIVEKGITLALHPDYQTRIEEYDDSYAFGRTLRPRWLRVDGPLCENWSCQVIAPIPTANAMQWQGDVVQKNGNWHYKHPVEQSIAFVKITNEYDKEGGFAGRIHFVEGHELANFDYLDFLSRVSANLPEWAIIEWTPLGKIPYEIRQGNAKPLK